MAPLNKAMGSNSFLSSFFKAGKAKSIAYLDTEEAYQFLQTVSKCEKSGIVVNLPEKWQGRAPGRAKVTVKVGTDDKKSHLGLNSLFQFKVNVTVDGDVLNQDDIDMILSSNQKMIAIRGKWVAVDKKKLENLLHKWKAAASLQGQGLSFTEAMRILNRSPGTDVVDSIDTEDGSWIDFQDSLQINEILKGMLNPSSLVVEEVTTILSQNMNATLRPYQVEGVKWLRFLSKLGLGGCLADDMGLGKTIQIIGMLLLEKYAPSGSYCPSLLVVPASLLGNWESEILKFAPNLKVKILHPSRMSNLEIQSFEKNYDQFDVIITSYSLIRRVSWLEKKQWNSVIADEAQAIKNPNAQQTKSLKAIKSRIRIAMTGTPIENSMTDLWSLFDFTCKSLLGNQTQFTKFCKNIDHASPDNPIRRIVQPYIIRRHKTDKNVIKDLPDKVELKSYCLLTVEQIKLYKQQIKQLTKDLEDDEISSMKRKGLILSYILKLKQICNHPSQFHNDNIYDFKKSGKFNRLKEIAESISSSGEKVLIFTQFKEITDILSNFLSEIFKQPGLVLHGGTPIGKRTQMVEEFQTDSSTPFFVLSIKAGGTGLNLTKASHVIHFDRWWNPAVENQATDRAFRIGQKKNVIVHKFICRGTIEEKIDLMIDEKKDLAEGFFDKSKGINLTELSNQDIIDLVSLNIHTASIDYNQGQSHEA